MKVLILNGSPKSNGNTFTALNIVCNELNKQKIETEIIQIGNKNIRGCAACGHCIKNQDRKCSIKDEVNDIIPKMIEADGIIISSPVYYSGVNGTMKSFLDRAFYVLGVNGSLMRHKVGASVVAVRRSGGMTTFNELNHFLNYSEMVVVTSNYWNVAHGTAPGEVKEDAEGVQIMEVLGKNMAWMLNVLDKSNIEKPERVNKVFTNFIR
ncbi:MAG: flavodoxin family protein [Bacilli bacterium]